MSKLLRFKFQPNNTTELTSRVVPGFGKQPVLIQKDSLIALKNYNIQLTANVANLSVILNEEDVVSFGLIGSPAPLEPLTIEEGPYTVIDLIAAIDTACNFIPNQLVGIDYGLETKVTSESNHMIFTTHKFPAAEVDLNVALGLIAETGGPIVLGVGTYDGATNGNIDAEYVFLADDDIGVCRGADCFSATIVNLGDNFDLQMIGESEVLWGIAYSAGTYQYYNNNDYDVPAHEFEPPINCADGDEFSYYRSGLVLTFTCTPLVGAASTRVINLDAEIVSKMAGLYLESSPPVLYRIASEGHVNLDHVTVVNLSHKDVCQTDVQANTVNMQHAVGLKNNTPFLSTDAAPAVLTCPNETIGGIDYKGIMVCITGLDLESYDLYPLSEGKVNYLYTIQKSADILQATSLSGTYTQYAIGDIASEVYIKMNNFSSMNINNKLSIFFLDTASGRRLEFDYADLLLIIKE